MRQRITPELVVAVLLVGAGHLAASQLESPWPYAAGWLAAIATVGGPPLVAWLRQSRLALQFGFQAASAATVAVATWIFSPPGEWAAPIIFGGVAGLVAHAALKWWQTLGIESETTLHGAEKIPLELSHPYLQVKATRVASGRVTIVVDGVAKDLSIELRRGKSEETHEQRTGDLAFDSNVRVKGNSLTCRSLLDPLTRAAVRSALDRFPGLTVNAGVVSWSGRPPDAPDAAAQLLDLASKLLPPDLLAGLEKSALSDPSATSRQRALDLLISRFAEAPETRRIATSALGDAEPIIRLRAAIFLGEPARPQLAALATSETVPAEIRAEAVRNAGLLSREVAEKVVRDALADRREIVRNSAIVTVGKQKLETCNDRLAILLRRSAPALQMTIVEAAAATDHESAETPLLAALAIETAPNDVKLVAVRMLARLGSIRSIEPLLAMRGSHLIAGELGPAAGAAVLAIQGRLAGAGAGQLALSENTGGEISFPGAERGSLALPEGEIGALTLSQEEVEGVAKKSSQRRTT